MTLSHSRFRQLLVTTTALAVGLVLLGVYTAAEGAGLACDGRWPLCDGWMGLFPANWPSFVEWFHRLVAMIVGFLILGTALAAWLADVDGRIKGALAAAVVALPIQIWLGAETVLAYTIISLTAHFVAALVILALLTVAVAWTYGPSATDPEQIRRTLVATLALLPVFVAFAPGMLFVHTSTVQVVYYGLGVCLFVALVAVTAWSGLLDRPMLSRVGILTATGAVLIGAQLVIGRLYYSDLLNLLDTGGAVATFAIVGLAAWLAYRVEPDARPAAGVPRRS